MPKENTTGCCSISSSLSSPSTSSILRMKSSGPQSLSSSARSERISRSIASRSPRFFARCSASSSKSTCAFAQRASNDWRDGIPMQSTSGCCSISSSPISSSLTSPPTSSILRMKASVSHSLSASS